MSLIIDKVGFDVAAMSQMPKKQFVELHQDNPAIKYGKSDAELKKWLEDAHAAIVEKAKASGAVPASQ